MDLTFGDQDAAFRAEVREFLASSTPPDLKYKVRNGIEMQREDVVGWHKVLYDRGWVAPSWPKEYGGPGWSLTQKYIFDEELGLAGAPRIVVFGINMCGPVLIGFGTEEQKRRFLPPMLSGDEIWCQGYSEPDAGSDLASLRTTAIRDGDEWVINGTKTWTTKAHWSDWCFLLARTSSEGKKQEGISFILVDLKSPGIEIRPIYLMDGLHETNMVFYTDVRVPVANTVGKIHNGWSIGKYLLAHERMSGGSLGQHKTILWQLKEIAIQDEQCGGRPLIGEPNFAHHIAAIEMELRTLEAFNMRAIDKFSRDGELGGKALGAEANIFKIRSSEILQRLHELKAEAIAYYAMPYQIAALQHGWNEPSVGAEYANSCTPNYLHFRKVSIYSGSNEIQHNILAKAQLGM